MRPDKLDDGVDEWGDPVPKRAAPKSGQWVRARWSVSPLREAKVLLGVLKQEGLAGKGLIEAFEKYSVRFLGYTRSDMAKLYTQQTGRDLTNDILTQKADKVIRYNEFEQERALLGIPMKSISVPL